MSDDVLLRATVLPGLQLGRLPSLPGERALSPSRDFSRRPTSCLYALPRRLPSWPSPPQRLLGIVVPPLRACAVCRGLSQFCSYFSLLLLFSSLVRLVSSFVPFCLCFSISLFTPFLCLQLSVLELVHLTFDNIHTSISSLHPHL